MLANIGTRIASFVDTSTGFSLLDRRVTVPIIDPFTGRALLRLEGRLDRVLEVTQDNVPPTGTIESLNLITEERGEDLSADDPNIGTLSVGINAGLELLPEGVNVEITIKKELRDEDRTGVELAAREGAKIVASQAGTITVETTGLATGDVREVEITLKVSFRWVLQFGLQNLRVAHVDPTGAVELLKPVCDDLPDANLEITCVAKSDKGFSEFSLLALADVPAEFRTGNLVIEPRAVEPGEAVQVNIDVTNDGVDIGTFSAILAIKRAEETEFEPVDVQEITLKGGESGTVTFLVLQEIEGRYDVEVEGLRETFDVAKRINPADLTFGDPQIFLRGQEVPPGVSAEPEDPLEIRMEVFNAGDEDGRTEVALSINGAIIDKQDVTVPGKGSTEVVFDFAPPAPGTLRFELVFLAEQLESKEVEITIEVALVPARFVLGRPDVSPAEVFAGKQVEITFQVTNVGELAGDARVMVLVNGDEKAREDVSLLAFIGDTVSVIITAPEEPGTYTVRIEGIVVIGDPDAPVVPQEVTFTVLEPPVKPIPRVLRLTIEPDKVEIGKTVTVEVELVNDSDTGRGHPHPDRQARRGAGRGWREDHRP